MVVLILSKGALNNELPSNRFLLPSLHSFLHLFKRSITPPLSLLISLAVNSFSCFYTSTVALVPSQHFWVSGSLGHFALVFFSMHHDIPDHCDREDEHPASLPPPAVGQEGRGKRRHTGSGGSGKRKSEAGGRGSGSGRGERTEAVADGPASQRRESAVEAHVLRTADQPVAEKEFSARKKK